VHGDFDQFVKVLRAAKLINEKNEWIGGKTHLVQMGDVLDRAPDSRKAMDLLMRLEKQAAKAGGAVHALVGNHEAMILKGDWRYVHPGETAAFGGADEYRKAMGPDGKYGKWIRSHNAVIKINDVLFLHGGISRSYADKSLTELNKGVREGLQTGGGMARDSAGPLWYRGLVQGGDEQVAKEVEPIFETHGVKHIVVGHTVVGGIVPKARGKVIAIDAGMSTHYGGPAACLLIEKGLYYRVESGKPKTELNVLGAKKN